LAAAKVLAVFDGVRKGVDSAAPTVEAVLSAVDPQVVPAIAGIVELIDAADAAIDTLVNKNADGSVTLTLTPAVVTQVKALKSGAADWLKSAGVKT
jgi:hypothetical protein